MLCQGLPAQLPGKQGVWVLGLQFFAHRAVAHQYQAGMGVAVLDGLKSPQQKRQVFFWRQSADANHSQAFRPEAPTGAQWVATVRRIEGHGINTAANYPQVMETHKRQRIPQSLGRHHGAVGPVVKLTEVGHDGLVQETHAIVGAVTLKIGAVVARHWQFEVERCTQRRPPQRPLGCDVDKVWALELPQANQPSLGRYAHAQFGVTRDWQTAHQYLLKA